jgi:hypothetical protein
MGNGIVTDGQHSMTRQKPDQYGHSRIGSANWNAVHCPHRWDAAGLIEDILNEELAPYNRERRD